MSTVTGAAYCARREHPTLPRAPVGVAPRRSPTERRAVRRARQLRHTAPTRRSARPCWSRASPAARRTSSPLLVPMAGPRRSAPWPSTSPGSSRRPGLADAEQYSLAGFAADVWAVAGHAPPPARARRALLRRDWSHARRSWPIRSRSTAWRSSPPGPAPSRPSSKTCCDASSRCMDAYGLEAVWQGKQALDADGRHPGRVTGDRRVPARRVPVQRPGVAPGDDRHRCAAAVDQVDALAAVAPPTLVVVGGATTSGRSTSNVTWPQRLAPTLVELPERRALASRRRSRCRRRRRRGALAQSE